MFHLSSSRYGTVNPAGKTMDSLLALYIYLRKLPKITQDGHLDC